MFCGSFVFQFGICPVLILYLQISRPLAAVVSVSALSFCVVSALNSRAIQSEACISAAKYERSSFFSGSRAEISFTENKMKRKRTDGESVKAVKEQVFLSRYKSEPGIVESSVSKSSAY